MERIVYRNPRTSKNIPGKRGENYTIPRTKYKYELVSWEHFMNNTGDNYKTVRSSFIPYVIKDKKRYFVLGSFHDYPRDILMDFGGSCILSPRNLRNYQHPFGCAMLELNEESKGLLVKPVLKSLGTSSPYIFKGIDHKRREYVWFVMVKLNYPEAKDIIDVFDKTPLVLKGEKLGPLDLYLEADIYSKKYRTSRNLTDFMNYLKGVK